MNTLKLKSVIESIVPNAAEASDADEKALKSLLAIEDQDLFRRCIEAISQGIISLQDFSGELETISNKIKSKYAITSYSSHAETAVPRSDLALRLYDSLDLKKPVYIELMDIPFISDLQSEIASKYETENEHTIANAKSSIYTTVPKRRLSVNPGLCAFSKKDYERMLSEGYSEDLYAKNVQIRLLNGGLLDEY